MHYNVTNDPICDKLWDQIEDAASELNEYDFFRKVYDDNALALKAGDAEAYREVMVKGRKRTYRRGYTMA